MGEINKIVIATNSITTFRTFKNLVIDMLRGYPIWEYFGKFESVFPQHGKKAVEILSRHKVIERIPMREIKKAIKIMPQEEINKLPKGKERFIWYRLAPRGVDLGVSMINLEYNESVLKYNKTMRKLTIWIIVLSILTLGFGLIQLFFKLPLFDITSFFR